MANNSVTFNVPSTYPVPFIDSFAPPSVVVKSPDTTIILKGSNFLANVTTVKFNGTSLSATFVPNQTCGLPFSAFPCRGLQVTVPASLLTTVSNPPVTVTNPSPGGGSSSLNFTITPPLVQFSAPSYPAPNQCTAATITVTRLGPTDQPASVDFETQDFIATQKRDFTYAVGTLNFAVGDSSKTFSVLISKTAYLGGSADLVLSSPTGGTGMILGNPARASLDIGVSDLFGRNINPIDDAADVVCQHYHDFLNREPDSDGLAFWTNQITSCGTDPGCIQLKRINVSAAYFLSIEFQQTGYLVERMNKVAYGDASGASTLGGAHQLAVPIVRYKEFLRDTQKIEQGVVVLQPGWEQVLENNKQAFAADFVQRSRFTTALPTTMTPPQFVDKLNQNVGNVLSASDRATAIALFGSATNTSNMTARAQALRQVAENQNFYDAEFNRAFVLMQYFGYLRRNPNDPQDTDYTGWEFWLAKLNQFNGSFVNAEMVKAFITSSEYRGRFGP
jgi:hypothetical protein